MTVATRTIQMTVQQIELIRAALLSANHNTLTAAGFFSDDIEELGLIADMMDAAVVDGGSDEVHAFWA